MDCWMSGLMDWWIDGLMDRQGVLPAAGAALGFD
jgi:hypothetical protein